MGKADYTSAGGGLRLKGASKPSGISKKKKSERDHKKKTPTSGHATAHAKVPHAADDGIEEDGLGRVKEGEERVPLGASVASQGEAARDSDDGDEDADADADAKLSLVQKTEAERRHEEMRRRRLDERLKREGTKTHKERVEELNKYLSGLSEHHDMPRIGPG